MNRDSRRFVHALLAGTFAWFLWSFAGAFAQDAGTTAADASSAAAAGAAPQSRRDRRRAAKAETAAAEEGTQSAAAAPAEDSADEVDIVCKNIKPLGTRMAKRVCGTPAQWAAYERKTTDAASEDLRQIRNTGGVIATTPGPATGPP
jgi:hypothetical protein